jgi:stress response protein SCP2
MGINLQKGQRISLEKEAGRSLNRVVMGLGWGMKQVQSKGFLGFGGGARQEAVDLDASCLLFDSQWQFSRYGLVSTTGKPLRLHSPQRRRPFRRRRSWRRQ